MMFCSSSVSLILYFFIISSDVPFYFLLSYLEKYPYANVRQEVSTHLRSMKVRFLLTSYDKLHQFHEHCETTCKYTYTGDSWGVISLKLGNFRYSPNRSNKQITRRNERSLRRLLGSTSLPNYSPKNYPTSAEI